MATSLEKSKKFSGVIKPLHPSTNPEILVMIKKKTSAKYYSPSGKFAEQAKSTQAKYLARSASVPSGLKKSPILTYTTYVWRPRSNEHIRISSRSLAIKKLEFIGYRVALFA